MDTSEELAKEHWNYIKKLLIVHGHQTDINIIEYHYLTAFIHGYKHGKQKKND